jgi:hypothetical protein
MENKEVVNLNLSNSKVRVKSKTSKTGEVRKMKLLIDLNKDETLSYMNVVKVIKPEEEPEHEFIKKMFILGLNYYISEGLKAIAKEREAQAASGVGKIELPPDFFSEVTPSNV